MKIQTRMIITFVAVAFIPLVLIVFMFLMVKITMGGPFSDQYDTINDLSGFGLDAEEILNGVEEIYDELSEKASSGSFDIENRDYLKDVSSRVSNFSSGIIVRKGRILYYTSNSQMSREVWGRLPAYGYVGPGRDSAIYYEDLNEYIRQIDFRFSDASAGTVFIVVKTNSGFSKKLKMDVAVAIILIMLITALLVTLWNKKGILDPMTELSKGLTQVREGNFDYVIEKGDSRGEVGELLRNYEDMRMRLRENEEKSAEQERKNRELISNITHDLKTPITSIKGYVEGILDGVASTPEKQEKYLRTIYNKATSMDQLINELTLYSNAENDRIRYNFLKINVSDYFRDCIEAVGLDMENKGIRFEYMNTTTPDTEIIADPEQLRKVINNIVGNSVKYMDKEDKYLSINLLDGGDEIIIEISDNGKGIAPADIPRIFERFFRADSARNTSEGGSGIGLSIVKKIVEDHGGHIWATSKEGKGTCMHIVMRKYKEEIHG